MNKAINILVPHKYRRNKKRRKRISLNGFWKEKGQVKFEEFKKYICQAMERNLTMYSPEKKLSIYTDTSHLFWAACVVGSPQKEDVYTFDPMFFISGTFTGPGLNLSVTSKELFTILKALTRYQYIFYTHPTNIHVFTDHRNILGLMDPGKLVKSAELGRLERWKMAIQGFSLTFHHLEGEKNILADCLTRWSVPESVRKRANVGQEDRIKLKWNGFVFRISKDNLKKILEEQDVKEEFNELVEEETDGKEVSPRLKSSPIYKKFVNSRISYLHAVYKRVKGEKELLNEDKLAEMCRIIQKRINRLQGVALLIVQLHIASGHASKEEVMKMSEKFYWEKLSVKERKEMIHKLARVCLHCERPSKLMRRAYGRIIHGEHPNQLLHADFMKIRGVDILVITDDLSRKCLMQQCKKASAEKVVKGLIKWRSANGLVDNFILSTDKGSNFANSIVEEFLDYYGGSHNFTIVYSPWSNSGSERQNRALLKVLKTLASQYMDWRKIITERRKQVLDPIFSNENQKLVIPSDRTLGTMNKFTSVLLKKDEGVYDKLESQRKKARDRLNKRLPLEQIQYQPGDWVLIALKGLPLGRDKLRLSWVEPYQIVSVVGHNLYTVRNLKGRTREVHSQRISFYADKTFQMDEIVKAVWIYNEGAFEIKELLSLFLVQGSLNFTVSWKGFDTFEPTTEPFEQISEDQPEMVEQFLQTKKLPPGLKSKAKVVFRQVKKRIVREISETTMEYETDAWLILEYPRSCAALDQGMVQGLSTNKGWTSKEKLVLTQLIRVYGMGNWKGMMRKPWLPGKTKAQIISMTQKLCGTQAIGEYRGLRIPLQSIHLSYSLKTWSQAERDFDKYYEKVPPT
eukprot:augustus_masked-scaffold_16-processed-gene-0.46-mRNA-1 protein AED:1.00 eAED:1.00 QI:0/0/0/0/1/1/3/0/855